MPSVLVHDRKYSGCPSLSRSATRRSPSLAKAPRKLTTAMAGSDDARPIFSRRMSAGAHDPSGASLTASDVVWGTESRTKRTGLSIPRFVLAMERHVFPAFSKATPIESANDHDFCAG